MTAKNLPLLVFKLLLLGLLVAIAGRMVQALQTSLPF